MKKNKLFILGLVTVFVALVSLTLVSSTWAKYTSTASGSDTARVAYWGFGLDSELEINDLFKAAYDPTVNASAKAIAPGTTNKADFKFAYTNGVANAPEVDYDFTVSVKDSSIASLIESNASIQWRLNKKGPVVSKGTWGTWDALLTSILQLASDTALTDDQKTQIAAGTLDTITVRYEAGDLPDAFAVGTEYEIEWQWIFNNSNDTNDTTLGNQSSAQNVTIKIAIEATQVD